MLSRVELDDFSKLDYNYFMEVLDYCLLLNTTDIGVAPVTQVTHVRNKNNNT